MATRKTQLKIVGKAITLFNQNGTGSVSTNRIADACKISKGNLYYHFKNKHEIIQFIHQQIVLEMDSYWYQDHLHLTIKHLAEMFARQLLLILSYRFFYREMAALLRADPILLSRYRDNLKKRTQALEDFFLKMEKAHVMQFNSDRKLIKSMVTSTWLISDNWLNYVEFNANEISIDKILEGYDLVLDLLRYYFIAPYDDVLSQSHEAITILIQQLTPEELSLLKPGCTVILDA